MDNEQIAELKRLADDSETLDPWYSLEQIADGITYETDARFIAAVTPTVVLELIALAQRATEAKPSASAYEQCTHPACGRFKDGASWNCHAMADNACARPSASAAPGISVWTLSPELGVMVNDSPKAAHRKRYYLAEDADAAIAAAREEARAELIHDTAFAMGQRARLAAPEGYVLVPVEATPAMGAAYVDESCRWGDVGYRAVWDAMIAAAPQPQAKAPQQPPAGEDTGPLSCPFCGDADMIYGNGTGPTYCDNCGADGPDYQRDGKPVATWNTRAPK